MAVIFGGRRFCLFLAVTTLVEAVKQKYDVIVSAEMPYGGNILAAGGFTIFMR